MMQFAHSSLGATSGLTFYKLLGSGKGNGFNPYPDWSTYALLQVWEHERYAEDFFRHSPLIERYREKAGEIWTIYMRSIHTKGTWGGRKPFEPTPKEEGNPIMAIITRATIKFSKMRTFWKYVPTSERPLGLNNGLIFTKGIGEVPAIQMATFSLWQDEDALKKFAYQSQEHAKAIAMTKALSWYSEELFARFQPYRSSGTWNGKGMLPSLS